MHSILTWEASWLCTDNDTGSKWFNDISKAKNLAEREPHPRHPDLMATRLYAWSLGYQRDKWDP